VKSPGIKTMRADIRARHLARAVGDPLPGINAFAHRCSITKAPSSCP
jgi:hypothetical protein